LRGTNFKEKNQTNTSNMQIQTRIHLQSRLLPIVVGTLLIMQFLDPSPIWLKLIVGLAGLWLISFLWVYWLSQNLVLTREIRYGWAQVGDRLEERFTLKNAGWVPALWVEIKDHSNLPGYSASRVSGVDGNSTNRWTTRGVCQRRGLFTLGPTTFSSGDPFGVYRLELHDPTKATLMVTPPVMPLAGIEVAPGGRSGNGRPKPTALEKTVSAASVRQFLPGDNLRWIHWRTTARRGSPFIRLFDGTPAGDWWIFLDLDEGVQAGKDWDSTEESGVILAASLADRGIREGESVGLVVTGEQLVWLSPQVGDGQRWKILRALATASPGRDPLADLFKRNKPAIGQRSSLIIITPNVQGEWIEALIPLLWRGAVPTVILIDPSSFGSRQRPEACAGLLAEMGMAHYVVTRDQLDRPEARPGERGQWEWRVSLTGRAIPIKTPADTSWKALS
jgi:uncharacterized protein (DUF58 family)